jgi:hypothetical protein
MTKRRLPFGLLVTILSLGSMLMLEAQPAVARTITVRPVAGDPVRSGNRLWNQLAAISSPGVSNPYLLRIEAGVYDLGSRTLVLRSYVDVEGSGEGVTILVSTANANGTVAGADNCELRQVTVVNSGPTNAVALRTLADNFSVRNVTAIATGGTVSSTAIQNHGLSTRITSVTAQAVGASANAIYSRGGTMRDVRAMADGNGIIYASFNASSDGELVDVTASAKSSDAFAGALRNEAGAPTLRNLLLFAKGGDIGDGIVNGAGSGARIFDAVIHAFGGTSFSDGIRNEFSSAVISGAEIHVESDSRAYGITNFFSGAPALSDVRIDVASGGSGIGVFASGTANVTVDRSTVQSDGTSVETRDSAAVSVGASRLVGGVLAGTGLIRCVVSYDGNFQELNSKCLPGP